VQPLAAWLVARPQNAVIGLAGTLLLPILQIASGIFMVLLVLRHGPRLAVIEAAAAGALLAVVSLVAQGPLLQVIGSMLNVWLPALVIGLVLRATGSLTLTMQVSALLAGLAITVFYAAVDDLVVYWSPMLEVLQNLAQQGGLSDQAAFLEAEPALAANMLTMSVVLVSWTFYAVYLLFGYQLYASLPGETQKYGRFCDLNFGRVVAGLMAGLSLLAVVTGVVWIQSAALVMFAVFWLQGLAVVHWIYSERRLPLFVVIATYVLLPFLHVFLVLGLSVLGYTDAWFRYRRRAVEQQ
jgi:hypothetical protein